MASSRRRHLYTNANTTSNGNPTVDRNITADCIADCVGDCIYGVCFPSTPLPPPPSPYGDESGNGTTSINLHSRNRIYPTLIITAAAAVTASFLLLLALYAYLRFRHDRRRRSLEVNGEGAAIDDDDDLVQGSEIEHHIWQIRTQGLDESAISSIPLFVYRSGEGLVDGRDCSICLGDFREGDLARLLPKCEHAFHLPCIDRWLRSHVSCPLCRSSIVNSSSVDVSAVSPRNGSCQIRPEIVFSVLLDNTEIEVPFSRERDRYEMETEVGVQLMSEGSSSGACTSELPHGLTNEEEGLHPIRRSVSMDSIPLNVIVNGGVKEDELLQEYDEHASADRKKSSGYLKEKLRLELIESAKMERPLSSQSARWFFPRYGRSRNSVLPL